MILQTNFVKFLGITVDNTLSWKQHIDTITPKLNKACYIIRRSKLYLSNDALKMVHYTFFHSVMSYGLIFWGNSTKSKCVFKLQKRAIRITMGVRNTYTHIHSINPVSASDLQLDIEHVNKLDNTECI